MSAQPTTRHREQEKTAFIIVTVLATVVSGALIARSIVVGYRLANPVPYMDQWEFIKQLPAVFDGTFSLSSLFAQHNEHRIVTSKLLFLIDANFFDLTFYSCIICVYVCCLLISYLLARTAGDDGIAIWVVLSGFILSPSQYENLANGFQVSFPILQVCAMGSVLCLTRYVSVAGSSALVFLAAVLLDALAVFSLASGILLVVPAVWLALVYRRRVRTVALYLICHLAITGAFLRGYDQQFGVQKSHKVSRIIEFAALYLGSCLRDYGSVAIVLGCIAIVLLLYAMGQVMSGSFKHRTDPDPCQVAAVALAQFTLAGALATGVGRVSLGLDAAGAPRYAFFSIMMASSLFVVFWRQSPPQRPIARSMLMLTVLAISVASNLSPETMAEWRDRSHTTDQVGLALVNGVWSDRQLETIYPDSASIRDPLRFLAEHRLAMFSPRFASEYKPPLVAVQDQERSALPLCSLGVGTVARTGPHWIELTGATSDQAVQDRWVLAFDGEHRLLGYTRQRAGSVTEPGDATFDIALNAAELSSGGEQTLTVVLVPRSASSPTCRMLVRVQLPPQ